MALAFVFGLPLSLFEYLYHRYMLHSAILPYMRSMHEAHTLHHSLTSVKAAVRGDAPEEFVPVRSDYPVEHEHQTEAMEFPPYSLSIFLAVFMVLLGIPTKLLFPTTTILAIICSVTLYYSSYELWHAVLHLPFEQFWKPAMEKRGLGRIVKRTYAFHLMHHWRPTANLTIVGFWGVAVWDYALRTHRRPARSAAGRLGHLPGRGAKAPLLAHRDHGSMEGRLVSLVAKRGGLVRSSVSPKASSGKGSRSPIESKRRSTSNGIIHAGSLGAVRW